MANVDNLKAIIAANVYENHDNKVTANGVKAAMYALADAIGEASEGAGQFINVQEEGFYVVDKNLDIGLQVTGAGVQFVSNEWICRSLRSPRWYEKELSNLSAVKIGAFDQYAGSAGTRQGGINIGNYYFQFHNTNDVIGVYNLDTLALIQSINTGDSDAQYHCNDVSLGGYLYAGDLFPLFYVSMESLHQINVYHISNNFVCTKVQTISLPDYGYGYNGWVDAELGYLYWAVTNTQFYRCPIPLLSASAVTITEGESILLNHGSRFEYGQQGLLSHDGYTLLAFGINGPRELQLIDLYRKDILWTIELNLDDEPEGVAFYRDAIYVVTMQLHIYKITQ